MKIITLLIKKGTDLTYKVENKDSEYFGKTAVEIAKMNGVNISVN